ncbi:2-hydroxychromene-2-carboxylate isomerase [Sphingomonas sp.]|uniref:2-hydroxychromene-2-carboxylate isomerase n=1 Tax=Sphingomonas sp. TaxID=28214 RepID=UPI00286A04D2|nr:2-hydroxychromene-2-carboxylate isomerase [Sphingomonas sp.]
MSNPILYFDFASPNAYFVHRVLPGIESRTGARFGYVPVLLGGLFKLTGNQAPMFAFAHIPAKLAYEHREIVRFIERHGLTKFVMNPHFPVNTLLPMRGAVAAAGQGVLPAYVEAVFAAMWEQGVDCSDPAALAKVLAAAGLDAEALLEATRDEAVKAKLMANTQAAADHGAFGIPTFVVGAELYFGKDKLGEVERAIAEH